MGNHSKGPFDLSTHQAKTKDKKGTPGYEGKHRHENMERPFYLHRNDDGTYEKRYVG